MNPNKNQYLSMHQYAARCQNILLQRKNSPGDIYKTIDALEFHGKLHPMLEHDFIVFEHSHCETCAEEACYEITRFQTAINDFLSGKYWPTEKCLWANYFAKNTENAQISGFSIRIFRNNGNTKIEAASDAKLESILENIAKTINKNQTDEWFLANLMQALPKNYNGHALSEVEIVDILV